MLVTTMRVGPKLETAATDGTVDVPVSSVKDNITALLGATLTAGMEKVELVGGSGLGAIVKMGTCLQGVRLGARRCGVRRDRAT